jgi:hypothetical protein
MTQAIKNILRPIKTKLKMAKARVIRAQSKKRQPEFRCTPQTKRCFSNHMSPHYHYEYFGENTPVCCATHLYNILRDVTEILETHNLKYFISFGTLLGAVRHGGLIPWDTDTDLLIAERDKQKAIKALRENLPAPYVVSEDRDNAIVGNIIRVNLSKTNTLHVDLFTYLEEGEEIVFGYQRRFARKEIFPLQKIAFYDRELFAPHNIEKQLKTFYGNDYMKYAYKQWAVDKTKFEITDFAPANIEV